MKYTRELAQIKATQKRCEYTHYGRTFRTKIPTFEEWFLNGIRKYEAKGAEFELLEPGMVKITWLGQKPILRTVEDFEREYNQLFPSRATVRFEEGAGLSPFSVQAVTA